MAQSRRTVQRTNLNTLDSNCPLAVQLHGVPLVAFLLTILQALTLVVLQHAVLTAVVAAAEAAVTYDALCGVLAVFEGASNLLRGHAAAQWEGHVYGGVLRDRVGLKGGAG